MIRGELEELVEYYSSGGSTLEDYSKGAVRAHEAHWKSIREVLQENKGEDKKSIAKVLEDCAKHLRSSRRLLQEH